VPSTTPSPETGVTRTLLLTGLRDRCVGRLHTGLMCSWSRSEWPSVIAIDPANTSARRGFQRSTEP